MTFVVKGVLRRFIIGVGPPFNFNCKGTVTNPLVELVATALAAPVGGLIRSEPPTIQRQLAAPTASRHSLPAGLATAQIRNVVLFVMESVGANYVAGTGSIEAAEWTPRIAAYRDSTLAFNNVYTHTPFSTKALFSLLTSQYPLFSYEVETTTLNKIKLQFLSSRLKNAGRRTAFFMSGDFEFQSVERFLDGQGFDLRSDMRRITCPMPKYIGSTPEWPHLDSVDDSCTAAALIRWIDAGQPEQPFFALLWTGNTHWPYFPTSGRSLNTLVSDRHKNRYLGALRSSDAAIGDVLDHLATRGLLESTLIVVIGDHGEAFGEHGFRIHGNTIHEEETRIPLLLINPRISTPGADNRLGGLIDVAPTILHVLGLPAETTWEGRSLFEADRPDRIFMFAPNQEMAAGYREGNYKFIYQVTRKRASVFNLVTDPDEKHNIADEQSSRTVRGHLSGWLEQRDARFKGH